MPGGQGIADLGFRGARTVSTEQDLVHERSHDPNTGRMHKPALGRCAAPGLGVRSPLRRRPVEDEYPIHGVGGQTPENRGTGSRPPSVASSSA